MKEIFTNFKFENGILSPKDEDRYKETLRMLQSEPSEDVKNLQSEFLDEITTHAEKFLKEVERATEYLLRNHVTPVIKGKITKGKIRWRGLSTLWQHETGAFLGLIQRGTYILCDGTKLNEEQFKNYIQNENEI